jgi:hypothetical protein
MNIIKDKNGDILLDLMIRNNYNKIIELFSNNISKEELSNGIIKVR